MEYCFPHGSLSHLAQGVGCGLAYLSGSTGLRRTFRGGYESPGKLIGWAGLVQGSLTLLAASALLLDHAMSSLDFVVVGRSGSLQLLVVYLTLVTFKAEGEDAVVAAALLVLLPALTPPSPLRCRAGVVHFMLLTQRSPWCHSAWRFCQAARHSCARPLCHRPVRSGCRVCRLCCDSGCC